MIRMIRIDLFVALAVSFALVSAWPNESISAVSVGLPQDFKSFASTEILRRWTGAQIRIEKVEVADRADAAGEMPAEGSRADTYRFTSEHPQGVATFESATGGARISVFFTAWQRAWVPSSRVIYGQKVSSGTVDAASVNVTYGQNRELRGLFLAADSDISRLEARQTLLEGQPILSSAVQKIPDVRRGESVKLVVRSSGLELATPATAEESSHIGEPVRVTTQKSKRTLTGRLIGDGVVEVKL